MNPENLSYLANVFHRLCAFPWLKLWFGIALFCFQFFFDALNTSALFAVYALILMDSVTGLLAAYRTGTPIRSHKLLRTALKIAVYSLLISAGFVSQKAIPLPGIETTIIAALGLTELFSILENTARAGYTIAAKIMTRISHDLTP